MYFCAAFALFAGVSGLLMDKVHHVPQGWSEVGTPSPSTRFKLSIALMPADKELLHKTITNISTPGHVDYGKCLDKSALRAVVEPSQDSTNAVLKFLEDSGILKSDLAQHGDWIDLTADIETADRMMNASFAKYREDTGRGIIIRTQQYSLPDHVAKHVDMIERTTQFPREARSRRPGSVHSSEALRKPIDQNGCNRTITPSCPRTLYNLPLTGNSRNTNAHGHVGIAGFLAEYPQQKDFEIFAKKFAPYLIDVAEPRFISLDGEENRSAYTGEGEANLDVQYAAAMAYPVPVQYYYTHGLDVDEENRPLENLTAASSELNVVLLRYLRDLPTGLLPHSLSVSQGGFESLLPVAYARKICDMFGELGARGVTVVFASGDFGPGLACKSKHGKRLDPIFPARCPCVTSVGGTQFTNPEITGIASSGGFSGIFCRPDWQKKEVETYLDTLGTHLTGMYNSSATANASGTSASAPTVTGIVGLVDSALIDAGKTPLGFMNPSIYSIGREAFQDIDDGSSKGCWQVTSKNKTATVDLSATTGWDPITGIGTPDFRKLLSIAMEQKV
ncbi:hypothetical protein QM012_008960 [Aureobasidium pullulans]|uniref:Peptidase S53 domain-containing protein n=1 Tax=Aureobasidium pullulans TaxID=5580 RepID=A0ABR0TI42_AURPU